MAIKPTIIRVSFALGLALTGCAMQKPASLPQDLPAEFESGRGGAAASQWPSKDWYRDFDSDELNSFVDLAEKNNWDVAAARARVAQADARARQAGAAILPSVDATGNANFLAGHSSQGSGHELDWSAMLSASYVLDFWGKNRAAALSARLLAGASRADRDTIALTTLAGVSNGYFQILALRERLRTRLAGRTVVQVTHRLDEAADADLVIEVSDGRIRLRQREAV